MPAGRTSANAACPIAVLRAAGHPDRGDDAAALHHRADLLFRDARPVAWRGRRGTACRAHHGRRLRSGHRLAVRPLAAALRPPPRLLPAGPAGRRRLLRHAVLATRKARRALSRLLGRGIVDGLYRHAAVLHGVGRRARRQLSRALAHRRLPRGLHAGRHADCDRAAVCDRHRGRRPAWVGGTRPHRRGRPVPVRRACRRQGAGASRIYRIPCADRRRPAPHGAQRAVRAAARRLFHQRPVQRHPGNAVPLFRFANGSARPTCAGRCCSPISWPG